ncbi:MAG: hypothetical protein JWN43_2206 [Gammaproteobacteria bacterium]|nr:hypothetical protein [Gammaproteobacteria bacterium]
MRVVLRTRRVAGVAGGPRYRQTVLNAAKLTIGRGADQLIQISGAARLALAHAWMEQRNGALHLRVLADEPVAVNGLPRIKTILGRGDVLSLGTGRLRIEDVRADGVVVLRLDLAVEEDSAETLAAGAKTLRESGLRAAPASWTLVLGVLVLTLLFPLLTSWNTPLRTGLRNGALVPSDALWQPGPLHMAHRSIAGNCNACHRTAFGRVADQACSTCHPGTQHHVPIQSQARARFSSMTCADCHVEHAKPSRLVDTNSRACVACHGDLRAVDPGTSMQNVTDFGSGHPDFSLAMLEPERAGADLVWHTRMTPSEFRPKPEEHSNLKFSHKVHLDERGIKSPAGDQKLTCGDCHRADAGGRSMVPIRMEQHCARCHSLQFDEHDSSTAVPHGDLKAVFTALEEHFSRMFLLQGPASARQPARRRPGGEQAIMTRDEQRRALEWTTRQSLQAARELLEKRVCAECHTVSRLPGLTGFEQWRVEPVKVTSFWMPRAQFNHAAHRSSTCISCHSSAERSGSSSDVLMPAIKQCRGCHGGGGERTRLASDCTMCHRLHLPGRGDLTALTARHAGPSAASIAGAP